ncbi:MAG TPA: hypothetical protein DCQ64_09495 [Candidatus Rokubacteria bacterium]|nr:hypothetical protein [Candidatus Rokubacteria bacterium]
MSDRNALCLAFLKEFPTEELARFVPLPACERLLRLAGLTAPDAARANLSSLAETCALRAEMAHRARALRYVADTLASFGRANASAIVDNALRCTRSGTRPVKVTVSANIGPLLNALDGLVRELRSATRPV